VGIEPVLVSILVAARRARSWRAAMHTATLFASYGRRTASATGPRLGPAARAGTHRPGVTLVITGHLVLA
jgi:hypothetical protein